MNQVIKCPKCLLDNREIILGEIIGDGTVAIARQRNKYSFEESTLVCGPSWSIVCGYCRGTAFYRKEEYEDSVQRVVRISWLTFNQNGIEQRMGSMQDYTGTPLFA